MLFPVGIRFGWNLYDAKHLETLKQVYAYVLPSYTGCAMPCRFWCQAGNRRYPHKDGFARTTQQPRLNFVVCITREAWLDHGHAVLEHPHTSHIWSQSQLRTVTPQLYGVTCPHGAYQTRDTTRYLKPTTLYVYLFFVQFGSAMSLYDPRTASGSKRDGCSM